MLVVSKTRYVPTAVNMIVLQGSDEMFYYLHRSVYDQCVILRDQYINLLPSFYKLFGLENEHPEVCDAFMEMVPEPLDILGPFLSMVTECEQLDNIEDMCGALSSMSMSVDFRKMFKVPAQVRQSIKFSLTVREEYRIQWDRFFLETPELSQVTFSPIAALTSASNNSPTIIMEDGEPAEVTYVGDSYSTEDLIAQMAALDAAEEDEDDAGNDNTAADAADAKPKSGFAMLRGIK